MKQSIQSVCSFVFVQEISFYSRWFLFEDSGNDLFTCWIKDKSEPIWTLAFFWCAYSKVRFSTKIFYSWVQTPLTSWIFDQLTTFFLNFQKVTRLPLLGKNFFWKKEMFHQTIRKKEDGIKEEKKESFGW